MKTIRIKLKKNKTQKINKMTRYNENFISILEEFNSILTKQGEGFRANAYKKAAEQIMLIKFSITSIDQIKNVKGIGKTILEKLNEYITTGKIKALEKERNNPVNILTNVYGIGKKKAEDLVSKNITTINLLKQNINLLNDKQQIGLKYYDDILKRIPRDEIIEFESMMKKLLLEYGKDTDKFDIMGSYRRKKESSGDIDVLFTNYNNDSSIFDNILTKLYDNGYIKEFLSKGKIKSMVILQMPNKTPRRVDFMYAPPNEYAFTLLYFTGSKSFNVAMREFALQKGITLNEHGFSYMKNHIKGEKLDKVFKTEKDIFDFLNLKFKNPEERLDGTSLEYLDDKVSQNTSSSNSNSNIILNTTKKNTKELTLKKNSTLKFKVNNPEIELKKFLEKGKDYLYTINEKTYEFMIKTANDHYYNQESLMLDEQYDILKEVFDKRFPNNKFVKNIGAPIKLNKTKLPYPMPSMNKIKPTTNALDSWKTKYNGQYIISNKLDGVSGLYTTENQEPQLFTRGDGEYGKNISHLIPYLNLPTQKNITIRGEFLISKKIFEDKYKKNFANARNLVSGIINQQKIDTEKFNDLHFVAYELLFPVLKPSQQFDYLKQLNMNVVSHILNKTITNDILSSILLYERNNSLYEIDGIIISNDDIYERENKNPEHAFAFKMIMDDQKAESIVTNVLWSPSKDGYLKPRVQIVPVELCGVTIEYLTGFNGAFINDNKIGIGATIEFIRSGDVIPHITKVIKPTVPKMPEVDYCWNSTNVDIQLKNPEESDIVIEKTITLFFKTLDVEGISSGNVSRLMKAGYNNIESIIKMKIEDFLKIEGFKNKLSTKIYNSIHEKIKNATLPQLMSATNLFGRNMGEKRLEIILKTYPKLFTTNITIQELTMIKGLAKKTASQFINKLPSFIKFINDSDLKDKLNYNPPQVIIDNHDNKLYNKKIVITGFRSKEFEEKLKEKGCSISATVTNNVFAVIAKNKNESSTKIDKASELQLPIYDLNEFINKYIN